MAGEIGGEERDSALRRTAPKPTQPTLGPRILPMRLKPEALASSASMPKNTFSLYMPTEDPLEAIISLIFATALSTHSFASAEMWR